MSLATTSPMPASAPASSAWPGERAARVLFGATAFAAAALVFVVQPMAAKRLLPAFGGSPSVWNTAVVFFQLVLLAGYALAHGTLRRLASRRQAVLQVAITLIALLVPPFALAGGGAGDGLPPALRVVLILALAVGVPYLALTMASPALQRWYADLGARDSDDPYFLYVASNAGSLLGLLAFPLLLERTLTSTGQLRAWSLGFAAYVLALGACAIVVARRGRTVAGGEIPPRGSRPAAARIDPVRGARWVAVAALPSSLMLGVTTYLTTDIASVPFLWVPPLALYLLSFMLTFGRRVRIGVGVASAGAAATTIALAVVEAGLLDLPTPWRLALHLATLLAAAVLAHAWLYRDRPGTDQLTLFYLLLAIGGVVGGAFNALLAPVLFDRVVEYPLLLAAVLLLAGRERGPGREGEGGRRRLPVVRWVTAAAVAGVFAFTTFGAARPPLFADRTFFGVVRVQFDPPGMVHLEQGTTVHGSQFRDPRREGVPTSYYSRPGPLGDLFDALQRERPFERIGVVGLGAGTVMAYGRPEQTFTFYEIDPAVIRIATDPTYFTYLARGPSRYTIVEGDARLRLAEADSGVYDLLILDAYSSDHIPVHLLTTEAIRAYRRTLAPGGVLAFHLSSRHMDLVPVVAANASALGLAGLLRSDPGGTPAHAEAGAAPSRWAALAADAAALRPLAGRRGWRPLPPADPARRWTDDFSEVVGALTWWDRPGDGGAP